MRAAAAAALLLVGCQPDAPARPEWIADVRPILAASCIRCHGSPAIGGAPVGFRLDSLDDVGEVKGARSMAEFIAARTGDRDGLPRHGPYLFPFQEETLASWKTDRDAAPRPGNRAPEASLTVDGAKLRVEITDADRDLVVGELRSGDTVLGPLHAGANPITWNTAGLASGRYPVTAVVNDGSGEVSLEVGTVDVSHTDAAMEVRFLAPAEDAILNDREPATFRIAVTDVDSPGVKTVTVKAFHGGQEVTLAADVKTDAAGNLSGTIDLSKLEEATSWRLLVETGSGDDLRFFISDLRFIVSHATTTETYATVKPILDRTCARCHRDKLASGPDFTSLADLRGLRGRAWRKVSQLREMPPTSMKVVLPDATFSEDDRARVAAWLFAGAPQ